MTAKIKSTAKPLYIINFVEIAYHQNAVLHIIKSQKEYARLRRDDIQPLGADDIHAEA